MTSAASLLYSAAQVRALDAYAISQGTPGYTLMKRAGEAALRALRSRWPTAMHVGVVTGSGNNGGDGFVLARLAGKYFLEVKMPGALPVTLSALVLITVAVVASMLPAARAARVDVMQALRSE